MPQALFISKEVLHAVVCKQFFWHLLVWSALLGLRISSERETWALSLGVKMQTQHCWNTVAHMRRLEVLQVKA